MGHGHLINFGLAAAFVGMGATGLLISQSVLPALGLGSGGGELFEELHEATGNFALLMVGTHVLMHWKWIWVNIKKLKIS